jgi:outer membrane protein
VIEEAGRSTSLARQNLWPQLDLNLRWTRLGYGTSFGTALGAGDGRFDVFLSTSYPLERSSAKVASPGAEMNERAAVRAAEQQGRAIEAEVRSAIRDLERLRRSIALQGRSVEIAEQQHRLANLRYQRGLASNFDVVDAEGSLVLARSALVGLLTSWQVARLELRRATGELDLGRDLGQ